MTAANHSRELESSSKGSGVAAFGNATCATAGGFNGRTAVIVMLVLVATTLAVYWPVLSHDFISYDDPEYVTANANVTGGLTVENFKSAFSERVVGNWHPITMLSHMLDCELFGLRPAGHHLTNLLFHAVNAALLFLFLFRATGALWPAAFVAALFALHPLHVESVAWVAERKDVLSTFFGLLALLAYERYVAGVRNKNSRTKMFYGLTLLFFVLSLMSKPMLVTLPFVLLLLDCWPFRRLADMGRAGIRLVVIEKWPFFAVAFAFCALTVVMQKQGDAVVSLTAFPPGLRVANALMSYARYLGKTFWPFDLAVYYPYVEWPMIDVVLAALFLIVVSGTVFWLYRRTPFLAVGWYWYLGTLVPVIGLVQVGSQSMADRYTYVPLIGIFVMLAWGVECVCMRLHWRRKLTVLTGIGLVSVCAVLTRVQLAHWRDSVTLFSHALEVNGNNYIAHAHLGVALVKQGRFGEAESHARRAIEIEPADAVSHNNLGMILRQRKQLVEAESHSRAALRLKPDDAEMLSNLGLVLADDGRFEEAIACYGAALKREPQKPEIHYNIGNALAATGRNDEATASYAEALRLKPDYYQARVNCAVLLIKQGKHDEAITHLRLAVELNSSSIEARNNLAFALAGSGQFDEAIREYAFVLSVATNSTPARLGLANALLAQGRKTEAKVHLVEAVSVGVPNADAHYQLGLILATEGDIAEAILRFRDAVRLNPDSVQALNALAWLLATATETDVRNADESVQLAERAANLSQFSNPLVLDTLAAAYAEAGRYDDAVNVARRALGMIEAAGNAKLQSQIEQRLKNYEDRRPWRE